jgi:hypothetical protein
LKQDISILAARAHDCRSVKIFNKGAKPQRSKNHFKDVVLLELDDIRKWCDSILSGLINTENKQATESKTECRKINQRYKDTIPLKL